MMNNMYLILDLRNMNGLEWVKDGVRILIRMNGLNNIKNNNKLIN
jgi:hypothetical protein